MTHFWTFVSLIFSIGSSTPIRHISLRSLIPNTDAYMTYEGSTTHPGCWESAVWIILNKPIYITKQEVSFILLCLQFLDNNNNRCIFHLAILFISLFIILYCLRINSCPKTHIQILGFLFDFAIVICVEKADARIRTDAKGATRQQCPTRSKSPPSHGANEHRFQAIKGKISLPRKNAIISLNVILVSSISFIQISDRHSMSPIIAACALCSAKITYY